MKSGNETRSGRGSIGLRRRVEDTGAGATLTNDAVVVSRLNYFFHEAGKDTTAFLPIIHEAGGEIVPLQREGHECAIFRSGEQSGVVKRHAQAGHRPLVARVLDEGAVERPLVHADVAVVQAWWGGKWEGRGVGI